MKFGRKYFQTKFLSGLSYTRFAVFFFCFCCPVAYIVNSLIIINWKWFCGDTVFFHEKGYSNGTASKPYCVGEWVSVWARIFQHFLQFQFVLIVLNFVHPCFLCIFFNVIYIFFFSFERLFLYVSLNLVAADSLFEFWYILWSWHSSFNGGVIFFYFRQPIPEQAITGREVDVQDSAAGTVTDALHILQTTSDDSL